jgi:hypothetical protein
MTDQQAQSPATAPPADEKGPRLPYAKPTLRRLGLLRALTRFTF